MLGISRETLRKYDVEGLLKHTDETDGGYWLYDDDSLLKLLYIRGLAELGYTKKEIKMTMNSTTEAEMYTLFQDLIRRLEDERRKTDGKIAMLKALCLQLQLPTAPAAVEKTAQLWISYLQSNSLASVYDEALPKIVSSEGDQDQKVFDASLTMQLIILGSQMGNPVESEDTQTCVHALFELMAHIVNESKMEEDARQRWNNAPIEKKSENIMKIFHALLEDDEIGNGIKKTCGPSAIDYIRDATRYFNDTVQQRYKIGGSENAAHK